MVDTRIKSLGKHSSDPVICRDTGSDSHRDICTGGFRNGVIYRSRA